jgi:hypothetical protein
LTTVFGVIGGNKYRAAQSMCRRFEQQGVKHEHQTDQYQG